MEKQNYGDIFFLQKGNWKCILRHLGAFSRVGEAVFPNPTDRPWVSEDVVVSFGDRIFSLPRVHPLWIVATLKAFLGKIIILAGKSAYNPKVISGKWKTFNFFCRATYTWREQLRRRTFVKLVGNLLEDATNCSVSINTILALLVH